MTRTLFGMHTVSRFFPANAALQQRILLAVGTQAGMTNAAEGWSSQLA